MSTRLPSPVVRLWTSAALMAAVKMGSQLRNKKVVSVMSGGNMNAAVLRRILASS